MKLSKVAKAGLVVGLIMASTISYNTASAQVSTSGNGPYYATPSWDQRITTGRFVVLSNWNNEAVLDRETGLVWQRTVGNEAVSFADSYIRCSTEITGGRMGWRLPSIEEALSLLDEHFFLPVGHPFTFNIVGVDFWTATNAPQNPAQAISTNFAGSLSFPLKTGSGRRWCVRGGQGVNPIQ